MQTSGSRRAVIPIRPDATPLALPREVDLPMLVEARLVPRKTPILLEPALIGEKGRMLEQLRGARDSGLSSRSFQENQGTEWPDLYRKL